MRRPLNLLLTAGLLAATMGLLQPATAQEGQMDPKAMEEMAMKLMAPGAPHAQLAKLAGEWKATISMYMDGTTPSTSQGTIHYEVALGGRYLLGRYQMTFMGQPMEGLSIDG